jgi:hypothetical protein
MKRPLLALVAAAALVGLSAAGCGVAAHSATDRGAGTQSAPSGPGTTTAPGPGGSGGQTGQGGGAASRDTFQGSVASASGAYAGEGGRAGISVQVRGSGVKRPVKLVFHSLPCQGAPQCVQLDGTLTGEITAGPRGVPDTGRSFSVMATGRLTTLGRVTATGTGHGTGFIARGHELLDLTLISRSGRITLRSVSGTVRGFT